MNKVAKKSFTIAKWLALAVLVAALAIAISYKLWLSEVHPVVPNVLYRSAQLSGPEFTEMIKQYQIRSVLNLRGEKPKAAWYQQEIQATNQVKIKHYDLAMRAYQMPSKETLQNLVTILLNAPKPLLVHCEGGADRTGLAAAIFLILQNKPVFLAQEQYSVSYFVIHENSVGKLVIPLYANWLKQNHLTSSKENFLNWLRQVNLNS